jgi:uncharacterized low-complexity protein
MASSGLQGFALRSKVALGAATAAVLAVALVASMAAAPEAGAARLTACVNKKTGDMRLVSGKKAKKKCPKGWRKTSWEQGKGSPGYKVYSADGKLVGGLLGTAVPGGGFSFYTVLRNGGLYTYFPGGVLVPSGAFGGSSPQFMTTDCSGPAYLALAGGPIPAGVLDFYKGIFGGVFRLTYRSSSGGIDFGPAQAWKFSGGTEEIAAPLDLYELNSAGACVLDQAGFTGYAFRFQSIPAPPDFKGPLRLR